MNRGVELVMKTKKNSISQFAIGVFATLLLAVAPAVIRAQDIRGASNPQLERRVRHELVTLPYYGVFDNLAYSVNGGTVTLYGDVVRSSTRSDAAGRVKRLAGVTRVVNNIKVLPLSGFDDRIRRATYRSIAEMGGLYRYLQGANPSLHIVVNNGHVSLEGVVSGSGDRNLAYMAANRVPGVFSVKNNLRVEGEEPR
jgi:hyperosmotically inducible periplasmic protein